MAFRRPRLLASLSLAFALAGSMALLASPQAPQLPSSLTDQEFWRLTEDFSEPNGSFQSDNLMSNEIAFARMVPELIARTKPGGVYLGVGPEQNFTYIAAMKPRMVFITDIRRGNLHLQLMYKALFELSADRADFVGRLFTKKRPAGLSASSTVTELMNAYWDVFTGDEAAYKSNLDAIQNHLTKTRKLPLGAEDLDGIARVYRAFYWYGPAMTYSASTSLNLNNAGRGTTYWDLMVQSDTTGTGFSYLASEQKYAVLKDLETRNLVVPVVGNFAGPKALRAEGAYLKDHGATVSAFYVSNVEGYLRAPNNVWPAFCANVAAMPLDENSVFIRPSGGASFVTNIVPSPSGDPAKLRVLQFVVFNSTGGTTTVTSPRGLLMSMAEEVKACK